MSEAEALPVAALLAPLEPLAVGADPKHGDEYTRIRLEVDKLTALDGTMPDWALVEACARTILTQQAKCLTVASFFAAARVERAGWQGICEGCELSSGLLERFGADVFPLRPRARANALGWLVEQAASRAPGLAGTDAETLARVTASLQRLRDAASVRLADETPSFSELLRAVERAALDVQPVVAPPPQPIDAPPAPEPATPQALPTDEPGIRAFVRAEAERLIELGRARLEVDLRDARAYRWLRTGVWLHVERAPPEQRQGRTAVAPPLASERAALAHALAEERWQDAVLQSEDLLRMTPLCFDFNLRTIDALRALGDEHLDAARAVEHATRALHARLPSLAQGKFRDGSPFASPETLAWLHVVDPQKVAPVDMPSSEPSAPSARSWFVQRCELARTSLTRGERPRAKWIYLGLLQDVDAYALERWEPQLALEVVQSLCALQAHEPPAGVKDASAQDLYVRLTRLAPWVDPSRDRKTSA